LLYIPYFIEQEELGSFSFIIEVEFYSFSSEDESDELEDYSELRSDSKISI
jgi:hypothetical protein